MQQQAIGNIYSMEKDALATKHEAIIEDWRKLQTSDHFYYMCTKWFADGDVHKYFNPYDTPYEAFIAYNNVVHDLSLRIKDKKSAPRPRTPATKKVVAKKKVSAPAKKKVAKK